MPVAAFDQVQGRHLVVMGVAGAGKSTVGRLIADRLGMDYADADDFHTADAITKMRKGFPLTDTDRDPWLGRVGTWLCASEVLLGNGFDSTTAGRRRTHRGSRDRANIAGYSIRL